jgi:hypothetical protein
VGRFWVPGHSGVRGNEIGSGYAREGTVHQFVGPELALLVSRQNIRKKIKRWMDRQHMVMCLGLTSTQKQAQKLIPGSSATATVRLLSFNGIQSRVVTGLPTGHNTLRRHLYLVGLMDSPLCRKCGTEEKTSAHVLSVCEALATLRHAYLGSLFLDPENVISLVLGAIRDFMKGAEFAMTWTSDYGEYRLVSWMSWNAVPTHP